MNIIDLSSSSSPPPPPPSSSSSSSSSQHLPSPVPRFNGEEFFLNKLKHGDGGVHEGEIGLHDVFEHVEELQSVLIASFGYDPSTLDYCELPYALPITVISDAPSDLSDALPRIQEAISPEGRPHTLILAIVKESEGDSSHNKGNKESTSHSTTRGRGVFHPKVMFLQYPNFLRIVIGSANFTIHDWTSYTQVLWCYDAPRRPPVETSGAKQEDSPFCFQLRWFLYHTLHQPKELNTIMIKIGNMMKLYDITPPPNVQLVVSAPGVHDVGNQPRYGQHRLREILRGVRCQQVVYQMSSVGFMDNDFVEEMAASTTATQEFALVWPTMEQALSRHGMGCLVLPDHSATYLMNANARAARGGRDALRMRRLDVPQPHRRFANNHSKVIVGLSSSSSTSPLYIYIGSHNISRVAWGKLLSGDKKLRISSYEVGVLIMNPGPDLYARLPFDPRAPLYRTQPREEPFCRPRHTSRLLGYADTKNTAWDDSIQAVMNHNISVLGVCGGLKMLPWPLGKALMSEEETITSSPSPPLLLAFINLGQDDEHSNHLKRALSDPMVASVVKDQYAGIWLCPIGPTPHEHHHHAFVKLHFSIGTATLMVLRRMPSGLPPILLVAHLMGPAVKVWQTTTQELLTLDGGMLANRLVEVALRSGEQQQMMMGGDEDAQLQMAIQRSLEEGEGDGGRGWGEMDEGSGMGMESEKAQLQIAIERSLTEGDGGLGWGQMNEELAMEWAIRESTSMSSVIAERPRAASSSSSAEAVVLVVDSEHELGRAKKRACVKEMIDLT